MALQALCGLRFRKYEMEYIGSDGYKKRMHKKLPAILANACTCLKASHPLKRDGNDPEHYY